MRCVIDEIILVDTQAAGFLRNRHSGSRGMKALVRLAVISHCERGSGGDASKILGVSKHELGWEVVREEVPGATSFRTPSSSPVPPSRRRFWGSVPEEFLKTFGQYPAFWFALGNKMCFSPVKLDHELLGSEIYSLDPISLTLGPLNPSDPAVLPPLVRAA